MSDFAKPKVEDWAAAFAAGIAFALLAVVFGLF